MHLPGLVILRLGLSLKCLSWFLLGSHPSRVWTPSSLQSFLDMNGLPHIFCCWRFRRDATRILPWVSTQGVTSKCISRASRAARGPLPGAGRLTQPDSCSDSGCVCASVSLTVMTGAWLLNPGVGKPVSVA